MGRMEGRVFEDEHPRRQLQVCFDQFKNVAAGRAEYPWIFKHCLHIIEAGHGVEVELFVVVERCFFPHAPKDRIRVPLQVGVVGVVVDLVVIHCHLCTSPSTLSVFLLSGWESG